MDPEKPLAPLALGETFSPRTLTLKDFVENPDLFQTTDTEPRCIPGGEMIPHNEDPYILNTGEVLSENTHSPTCVECGNIMRINMGENSFFYRCPCCGATKGSAA